MADLTQRDAGLIERDRMLQFSQYGSAAVLKFFDREGREVLSVARYWNRYRKTTRDNVTYFRFRVADLRSAYAAAMKLAGDGGSVEILGERYRVTKLEGWKAGEPRVWNVTTNAEDAPASEFFRQP
jgi:hypothetical protein